jgi:predicted phosphodiesterase
VRLAVLADIHGNMPALRAVLSDARQCGAEHFVVAGDHIIGGPSPVETLQTLRSHNGWMIRGNTDNYLLDYESGRGPRAWYTAPSWAPLRWSYDHLDRDALSFIASLPEQQVVALPGCESIRVLHGSADSPYEFLFPNRDPASLELFRRALLFSAKGAPPRLSDRLSGVDERVVICGHSHIPWKQKENGRLTFNPGSVGGPVNGDWRAQYALLTWQGDQWHLELRAVPYDRVQTRADYASSGLLDQGAMARAFLLISETGLNVTTFLVAHAQEVAAKAGSEGSFLSDAIWDQAVATFDWDMYSKQDDEGKS